MIPAQLQFAAAACGLIESLPDSMPIIAEGVLHDASLILLSEKLSVNGSSEIMETAVHL